MRKKNWVLSIPPNEIERLLASTAPAIYRRVAIIVTEDGEVFSGVFVKCLGFEGILTAGHSASSFMAQEQFRLVVSKLLHRFTVHSRDFEHVPIGRPYEPDKIDGDDLSFVIIRNENLLCSLRNLSQSVEFHDITKCNGTPQRILGEFHAGEVQPINWGVAGCPREKVDVKIESQQGERFKASMVTVALIQCNFDSYELRGKFDYITLLAGSGFEDFPSDYNGMSGGGIWYQQFFSENGHYRVEPILAGIVCWQYRPTQRKGYRIRKIQGHGFVSIYAQVRQTLYEEFVENPRDNN